MKVFRLCAALLGLALWAAASALSLAAPSMPTATEDAARRLVSLVEYIGGDYPQAVQNGQIVSADEFTEMQEFAESSLREFKRLQESLPETTRTKLSDNLDALTALVGRKADVTAVRALTKTIKNAVIDGLAVPTAPETRPVRETAITVYAGQCASCHGQDGHADGPAAQGLEPPARNFHENGIMSVSSPFKFYNTLVLGVEGTSMLSFDKTLSEEEKWSLAFYLMGLRYNSAKQAGQSPEEIWNELDSGLRKTLFDQGLSLGRLSRASDQELDRWLKTTVDLSPKQQEKVLRTLRLAAPYLASLPLASDTPAASLAATTGDSEPLAPKEISLETALDAVATAKKGIEEARAIFAAGDAQKAESQLLDAYLYAFEKAEVPLGVTEKDLVTSIEQSFIAARKAARTHDTPAFETATALLTMHLTKAQTVLKDKGQPMSSAGDFIASLVIILREGFEAFLIVAAILALLTNLKAEESKKWIHAGWISAGLSGLVTYYTFSVLFSLSGAQRETIEAVSTGLAAVVLFYVSFWLLNQSERGKWQTFLKEKTKSAAISSGGIGTLFSLSFIAVYREAAETVLFYQALASSAASKWPVFLGFVVGSLSLLVVCWCIVRLGVRLPIKKFFRMTSTLMIIIAVVLAGKAVNELVEAGFLIPTDVPAMPTIDVLGIYPNWQSLGVQIAAIAVALILVVYSQRTRESTATAR